MTDRVVRRERLSDAVIAGIRRYIIEHGLGHGDRLPTEAEMAELFGVSRLCVREATKALGFLGIIHAAPRRGLTIGHVEMKQITEYLGFHLALSDYPKAQLLKTRIVIETGALSEAMESIASDEGTYRRLTAMIVTHLKVRDPDEYIRQDLAFHHALLEISAIEPLVAFNDLLEVFFKRFRASVLAVRKRWPKGIAMHRQIIDALRARNLKQAEDVLRKHLAYYRGHL